MKKALSTVLGCFMAVLTYAQTPAEPVCIYCGEPITRHKPDCIQADTQLLDSIFGKPDTKGCMADSFVVDYTNKEQILPFKDPKVKACALQKWDTDQDGELTVDEALRATELSLQYPHRRNMFAISAYDDLRFFPNLQRLHAGHSWVPVIDLCHCTSLKELDLSKCHALTTIILSEGCYPHIIQPDHLWKGETPKIKWMKPPMMHCK